MLREITLLILLLVCTCVSAQKRIVRADEIQIDAVTVNGLAKDSAAIAAGSGSELTTAAAVKAYTNGLGGGAAGPTFDPTKPILRVPQVGDTIPNFAWYYFVAPSITLSTVPSTTIYEIGTVNSITVSGSTSNPGAATLSGGRSFVVSPDATISSFGAATTHSGGFTFAPGAPSGNNATLYSFRATQNYSGAESGTITSVTRTVKGVYPVLFGVSATDYHASPAGFFSAMSKQVVDESTRTATFNGTGYLYFAVPLSWGDNVLSSIRDGNNFELLSGFTSQVIAVTSTDNTNNWTTNYRVYRLTNQTTVSNATYTFIR